MHPACFLKMASTALRISAARSRKAAAFPNFLSIAGRRFGEPIRVPSSPERSLHCSTQLLKKKNILSDELPLRLKPADIKVLLLNEAGQSIGLFPKTEAQRMAKQMDLKMVNVEKYATLQESVERSSLHPVYKMISGQDLHALQMSDHEERKQKKKSVEKILQLTSNAADHDIQIKISQAETWLKKGDNVRVLILGRADTKSRMNELHQEVLTRLKPSAKSAVSGLSKSERNISFVLESTFDMGSDDDEPQPVSSPVKSKESESDSVEKEKSSSGSVPER